MENPTSFDLNRAIHLWQENLRQSPAFERENLDELESHLRDSIAGLQSRGLSAEEAFLIATRRIGTVGLLQSEFGKVNPSAVWLERLFWIVIGYQVWLFISGIVSLLTRDALPFGLNGIGYDFKSNGYVFPVTVFTLFNLAGFAGSLVFCSWLFRRKGQRLGRWLGQCLQNRTWWVLAFSILYVLSLLIQMAQGGASALLFKYLGRERASELLISQSCSGLLTHLVTIAVFTWLTLFLARKRLSFSRA